MVTSKSAWLWAEIVKASSEAATEREFLELLIDHVRYTILQLKSVIDQSCKEGMLSLHFLPALLDIHV